HLLRLFISHVAVARIKIYIRAIRGTRHDTFIHVSGTSGKTAYIRDRRPYILDNGAAYGRIPQRVLVGIVLVLILIRVQQTIGVKSASRKKPVQTRVLSHR